MHDPRNRHFLFLQGPHGPFFGALGKMLRNAGARVTRVGFNRGDQVFWRHPPSYRPFTAPPPNWPDTCARLLKHENITDLVLYGDTRPIHAQAIELAQARGLCIHVFEEGYLRPYWITYERGGTNGHSQLMSLTLAQMRDALPAPLSDPPAAPATWGDMRQHMFYGALYHFHVLARNVRYPHFQPHRALNVRQEFRLHLHRLLRTPAHAASRIAATYRIRRSGYPYHLALLQLAHDSSFLAHGPFASGTDFIETCLREFARGAPTHHHLVFKAHPLEDGRAPLRRQIRTMARAQGLANRVHFVRGGKLAHLLDGCRSVVTVNSTAAQQALWRALPLKVFGQAVYAKPELTSAQPLAEFFANPAPFDRQDYLDYRQFLLLSSQIPGGYYSRRGRARLLRQICDKMLDPRDPYEALLGGKAAPAQQFHPHHMG